MEFSPVTFGLTILNLLILFWILKSVLFKPVTEFMEKRTSSIRDMFESAQNDKEQSEAMKAELKQQLDKAVEEAEKIVNEAKARAEKQHEEILNKAKEEAKAIVDKARKDIEVDRKSMMDELRGQIAGIALAAASKVIQKNLDTEANKKLIDQFIDEVGAA